MTKTFTKSIHDWVDKVGANADQLVKQVPQELAKEMIIATPVKTGFLRGSWYPSINNPEAKNDGAKDPSGGIAIAKIAVEANNAKVGDTFYLMNSAKYAMRVEFGFVGEDALGRSYNQSGRAFVRSSLARFEEIVQKVATRLNG